MASSESSDVLGAASTPRAAVLKLGGNGHFEYDASTHLRACELFMNTYYDGWREFNASEQHVPPCYRAHYEGATDPLASGYVAPPNPVAAKGQQVEAEVFALLKQCWSGPRVHLSNASATGSSGAATSVKLCRPFVLTNLGYQSFLKMPKHFQSFYKRGISKNPTEISDFLIFDPRNIIVIFEVKSIKYDGEEQQSSKPWRNSLFADVLDEACQQLSKAEEFFTSLLDYVTNTGELATEIISPVIIKCLMLPKTSKAHEGFVSKQIRMNAALFEEDFQTPETFLRAYDETIARYAKETQLLDSSDRFLLSECLAIMVSQQNIVSANCYINLYQTIDKQTFLQEGFRIQHNRNSKVKQRPPKEAPEKRTGAESKKPDSSAAAAQRSNEEVTTDAVGKANDMIVKLKKDQTLAHQFLFLTPEQAELYFHSSAFLYVVGPVGSGKTLLMQYRALDLAEKLNWTILCLVGSPPMKALYQKFFEANGFIEEPHDYSSELCMMVKAAPQSAARHTIWISTESTRLPTSVSSALCQRGEQIAIVGDEVSHKLESSRYLGETQPASIWLSIVNNNYSYYDFNKIYEESGLKNYQCCKLSTVLRYTVNLYNYHTRCKLFPGGAHFGHCISGDEPSKIDARRERNPDKFGAKFTNLLKAMIQRHCLIAEQSASAAAGVYDYSRLAILYPTILNELGSQHVNKTVLCEMISKSLHTLNVPYKKVGESGNAVVCDSLMQCPSWEFPVTIVFFDPIVEDSTRQQRWEKALFLQCLAGVSRAIIDMAVILVDLEKFGTNAQ